MTALALVAAACGSSSKGGGSTNTTAAKNGGGTQQIDYKALGLWNDGPCDQSRPPLKIGLMTVFESPVLSLKDQADALDRGRDRVQQARRCQRRVHPGDDL